MNDETLVVYDSGYGNTAKIAEVIAAGLGTRAVQAKDVPADSLGKLKLLVLGSPTQGGNMTPFLKEYFEVVPDGSLHDVKVAAFDTRFALDDQKLGLRMLMRVIGYAAPKIITLLKAKGGKDIVEPEGFIVTGKEGPLKDGELVRAEAWGKQLRSSIET